MGQYPSGHALGARHELYRFLFSLVLSLVAAFSCGRSGRRAKKVKALRNYLMGHWGFVILAYGIVWSAIVLYLVILKRRLRKVERAVNLYRDGGNLKDHG